MPSQSEKRSGKKPSAQTRYIVLSLLAMAIFTLAILVLTPLASQNETLTAIGFTIVSTLPLILVAYEFQRYVRALDELQSQIEMQSAAIGFGLALLIAAIWGLAEGYNLVPRISIAMTLPLGVVLHGAVRQIRLWRLG